MAPLDLSSKRVVLLLQGGGALGAYQVGAFRALAERCRIDWVGGISIGAINSAVIAGHKNENAVEELESLWEEILSPSYPPFDSTALFRMWKPWLPYTALSSLEAKYADWTWTAFNPAGQPHFFTSRVMNPFENPWFKQWARKLDRDELAFYDTAPMRDTLNEHVDWGSLTRPGATRLCLMAARVCDGEVDIFDSSRETITAEHVLASCALPPAFPPIAVQRPADAIPEDCLGRNGDKVWYFDGGVSSNTPIEVLHDKLLQLDKKERKDTVVFLVDLWDRKRKPMPATLEDVIWRMKSIQYGSRKKAAETVVRHHQYRAAFDEDCNWQLQVYQVMLENKDGDPEFSFSDADFSHDSFRTLKAKGEADMRKALDHPELVQAVSGDRSALYRYGTERKHLPTDRALTSEPADVRLPVSHHRRHGEGVLQPR